VKKPSDDVMMRNDNVKTVRAKRAKNVYEREFSKLKKLTPAWQILTNPNPEWIGTLHSLDESSERERQYWPLRQGAPPIKTSLSASLR